ncbi:MAG: RDD family protein [Myxococcales bacterium]
MPLDTDIAIETPEHIVFRYKVAGPGRRFFAYVIDLLLCYAAIIVIGVAIALAAIGAGSLVGAMQDALQAGAGLVLVVLFAAQWLYFAVLEGWRGTTPGKRAFGLRVVTTTGRPIGVREAALRNILRAADALPATQLLGIFSAVGLVSIALTKRFQRLGDLVAGTMVVVNERARAVPPLLLWPPATPAELGALPDVVLLDADERLAIELFLRRRPRLGRARELELAQMLAPSLSRRTGFYAADPSRTLALLYDRAANAGRGEAPLSSRLSLPSGGSNPWP